MSPAATPSPVTGKGPTAPIAVTPAATVTIHVGPGVVFCTPQGGNVHVYKARKTHAIGWHGDTPFTLEFHTFDDHGTREWPFQEAEPAWPVRHFTGTPSGGASPLYYKYTISAGGLFLDPIVIVDN